MSFFLLDCGTVPTIANGAVSHAEGTEYNATVTYSCDIGYLIDGVVNRTCQANGNWTDVEPTCPPIGKR